MHRRLFKKESKTDIALLIFAYAVLSLALVVTLYPLLYVVSASFSSSSEVASGRMWLFPRDFNVEGYRVVFENSSLLRGFFNSAFYAASTTILSLFSMMSAGFALSRKELPGKSAIVIYLVITMFFSGGLIPTYLVIMKLGMINTRWALILPGCVGVSNIVVARTFINSTISESLFDAAKTDGSGYLWFFARVVLPLSKPVMAVYALYTIVAVWGSYFSALLYLQDNNLMPLQVYLRKILVMNTFELDQVGSESFVRMKQVYGIMKYALIVVSTVPIMCIYPFIQKYFVKGIMVGSLKG